MNKSALALLALAAISLSTIYLSQVSEQKLEEKSEASSGAAVGAYFVNWAQYHSAPYTYKPENLAPIVNKLTHVFYAFNFFCPPEDQPQPYWVTELGLCQGKLPYDLITVEPKDQTFMETIVGYKSQNPNLKVVASIGGWSFPSAFWSGMVKSAETRSKFISNVKDWVNNNHLDGIDIDWEYPCSQPREDHVKITCWNFKTVVDKGGDCAQGEFEHGVCTGDCQDGYNFAQFLKELRAAAPSMYISIAASANYFDIEKYDVQQIDQYIDHWNLMSYDFFVSDIESANVTCPNQNMKDVPECFSPNWGIEASVKQYKAQGATPSKILLGMAYYGHTWFVPGIQDDSWQKFGLPATIQGICCGPFTQTYGGKPGKGCSQCGTMMYSEIKAAGCEEYHDSNTMSTIGYCKSAGQDGYTQAGTWVSYVNEKAIKEQAKWAVSEGLGGAFVFDSSMDTIEEGLFTYGLTHTLADALNE